MSEITKVNVESVCAFAKTMLDKVVFSGPLPNTTVLAARRQPRRTAGRGPPRQRRVPPTGAVAEVIREKGPTRVQSRCRRPPYPVPSAPATDTAPRSKRKNAPRTTDAVRHSGIGQKTSRRAARRVSGGVERRATAPPAAAPAQRFNHKYQ
ncbi:unnamed protein product [Pleuronectes platessa]|uniref:Uncharacterized protein n=1 Tax=Pleuronectes platessa TaxID=8262 RepID=A0A9N7TX74_PLEPL|nr:unnamed protein product [Pleuronectes platessa]